MPYSVSFNKDDGIITIRVSGKVHHDEHFAAYEEALRLCQEHMCSRMLVDLRELNTSRSSTVGCFLFGESVAKASTCLRIAHVMPADAKSKEDVEFTSTVEANRGVLTGMFETIDEAKNWLLIR